jgi:pimeloyl-ACP methyl ester carboxylesterase
MNVKQNYTKGSVTSKDGTIIGYRQMGSGPGIILLHGGISSSQYFMKLGDALSDEFTVYIPDRRGRGLSGPFGDKYGLKREVEDLDAILKKTGAHYVFGGSSGGLIALQASLIISDIEKIVCYEPVLYVNKSEMDQFNASVEHFDKELSEGKGVTAMVDITKSEGHPAGLFYKLPDFIMKIIFKLVLLQDEQRVKGDDVTIEDLMPTLKFDVQLVNETEGKLDDYKDVSAEVLLLSGSKSRINKLLQDTLDTLTNLLPHVKHIELEGLDHDSAQNYGRPEIIAQEIKHFYNPDKIKN